MPNVPTARHDAPSERAGHVTPLLDYMLQPTDAAANITHGTHMLLLLDVLACLSPRRTGGATLLLKFAFSRPRAG